MADLKVDSAKSGASTGSKAPEIKKLHDETATSDVAPSSTGVKAPSHEEISVLAYQLWQERGSLDGSHEEDWRQAEQQLKGASLPCAQAAKA